jgi:hypothetical protein
MIVRLNCPLCHVCLAIPESARGKSVRCGACQGILLVPEKAPESGEEEQPILVAELVDPNPPTAPEPASGRSQPAQALPPSEPGKKRGHPNPVARQKAGSLAGLWIVLGVGFFLFLGVVGASAALIAYYFWSSSPPPLASTQKPMAEEKEPVAPERPALPPVLEAIKPAPRAQDLPAKAAPVGKLKPAPLTADQVERSLPGEVEQMCVGGGGRYLILHLPRVRKLALFDANQAKVVKYLSVGGSNVKMAAGRNKLMVLLTNQKILQRWDLSTFEREASVLLPAEGVDFDLAMGSDSSGPLLVRAGGGDRFSRGDLFFFDIEKMRKHSWKRTGRGGSSQYTELSASANGRVFLCGNTSLILTGSGYRSYPISGSRLLPGPDGRVLFGTGLLTTAEGKKIGDYVGGHGKMVWYLPAVHGSFFFSLNECKVAFARSYLSVSIYFGTDRKPLFTLPRLAAQDGLVDWHLGSVPDWKKHVFLIPGAKLMVVIPASRNKLVLVRLDLEAELNKSGVDYLFVQSRPVREATKGKTYEYGLSVRSKKGGVQATLEAGPKGMQLTPKGKLVWQVPADFAQPETNVVLTVRDASGQEVFHTFTIRVRDKEDEEGKKEATDQPGAEAPPRDRPKPKLPEPEPAVEVKRPATTSPLAGIKPAPLKADREVRPLPSTVDDACVGGGGRFFILHLARERKLAIFDVNEAKVVKYLSVAEDGVKFAAGLTKLFVVSPNSGVIQRFSLVTFEKEVTTPLPIKGTVKAIATGSAATGPLLIHYNKGSGALDSAPVTFIDPVSLKELDYGGRGGAVVGHSVRDSYHYRASPDGTVFGGWVTSHSQSMSSIVLMGKTAKVYGGPMAGSVVPGADNTLVTGGGLYTPQCKPLANDNLKPRFRLRIPSQTGRFYLTCPGGGGAQINTGRGHEGKPVTVYLAGDARPIATLEDVELPVANEAWTGSDFTQDKRVLFVPEGKLIAILPRSSDRLVLHRFDLDEALKKAGVDYLFVVSRPPSAAYRGTRFTYTPQVKSKKGGVKFALESGPTGMRTTTDGKLIWDVPGKFAETEVDVILTVSDASAQEIFHTFKVAVRDRADANLEGAP